MAEPVPEHEEPPPRSVARVLAAPLRRAAASGIAGLRRRLRDGLATLAGGWHDVRPVAARVTAPVRQGLSARLSSLRSLRRRARARARDLRTALRLRR